MARLRHLDCYKMRCACGKPMAILYVAAQPMRDTEIVVTRCCAVQAFEVDYEVFRAAEDARRELKTADTHLLSQTEIDELLAQVSRNEVRLQDFCDDVRQRRAALELVNTFGSTRDPFASVP